jgi:hypothetical protein
VHEPGLCLENLLGLGAAQRRLIDIAVGRGKHAATSISAE